MHDTFNLIIFAWFLIDNLDLARLHASLPLGRRTPAPPPPGIEIEFVQQLQNPKRVKKSSSTSESSGTVSHGFSPEVSPRTPKSPSSPSFLGFGKGFITLLLHSGHLCSLLIFQWLPSRPLDLHRPIFFISYFWVCFAWLFNFCII